MQLQRRPASRCYGVWAARVAGTARVCDCGRASAPRSGRRVPVPVTRGATGSTTRWTARQRTRSLQQVTVGVTRAAVQWLLLAAALAAIPAAVMATAHVDGDTPVMSQAPGAGGKGGYAGAVPQGPGGGRGACSLTHRPVVLPAPVPAPVVPEVSCDALSVALCSDACGCQVVNCGCNNDCLSASSSVRSAPRAPGDSSPPPTRPRAPRYHGIDASSLTKHGRCTRCRVGACAAPTCR